jgi:hypothetical protein
MVWGNNVKYLEQVLGLDTVLCKTSTLLLLINWLFAEESGARS